LSEEMFAGIQTILVRDAKQFAVVGRRSFPRHHADKGYGDTTTTLFS
jgi:hypothetical protein